jgi:hypothetical protein
MKRILLLLVVAVALLVPGAAMAQDESSTCQAYNPQTCNVPPDGTGTTLPFTGLDATLLVVGGGILLGSGLVIRRLSRRLD